MTPERWQRVKTVLDASLDLSPGQRAAYLDQACQDDRDLRREVETLIASYENAGDMLEAPALAAGAGVVAAKLDDYVIGLRIGAYRVVEEIGRGGMGTVYRAVRDDEHFRKEVAIKLVSRGHDCDFIVRRFRHERQIMASLDHPNIARLLDGGSTEDGLPYFVMEYIQGRPIDKYCDERRLSTRDRLRLFSAVCSAVHYAHQKMVIHRDIKPGNILITEDGTPKLLDFGIAKILDPELSTQTAAPSVTILRLMTPEYASPEQVRGDQITEATDIYSLGVLLYELLTGHRPYRVKSRAPHELAHAICETDPEKPSTAISRVEEITRTDTGSQVAITPESVSTARRSRPEKLRRALAGDLDNIVLMAMRKEPHRRYASAEELAEDIQRHLDGMPVLARRDTLAYRTIKLLERNRAAAISIALIMIVFLGLLGLSRQYAPAAAGVPPNVTPFTSFPGDETQPSFSPDGKRIAFAWAGENHDNQDIYVRSLDTGELLRITTNPALDNSPAWSRDGRHIAFLRLSRTESGIFVSPAENGLHRKIADVHPSRLGAAGIEALGRPIDWSPDGRLLAIGDKRSPEDPFSIVLITVATGAKRRVTMPSENTIGDSNPAFSPDGRQIAFIRAPSSGITDLWVLSLNGGPPRRLTGDSRDILDAAWTPDGSHIVFSSNRAGNYNLWRVPANGGDPERMLGLGPGASDPSFTRDGRRLAFSQFFLDTNIWRMDTRGGVAPRKLIVSTQYDSSPQFSPDGKRVAFRSSRSGYHEIWIGDNEGLSARRLTHYNGPLTGTPRWSPDGRWVAFDSRPRGQADIFVVDADGGTPRPITTEPSEDVVPSFSGDGQWIYFASNRSGAWQVWRAPFAGGPAEKVTRQGGFAALESPDGEYLYYARGRGIPGLWRIPLRQRGSEEPVIEDLKAGFWGYWAVTKDGVYFVDQFGQPPTYGVFFYNLRTRRSREIGLLERRPMVADSAFALSPDGRYVLYTQIDQSGSDIMVADYTESPR